MLPHNIHSPGRRRRRSRLLALTGLVALSTSVVALVPQAASAASTPATLAAGHTLTPGQKLLSPDAAVELVMQGDGNLVAYGGGRALWSSGTAGHNGATAVMQTDGNLVVRTTTTALWNSHTAGTGTTNHLALQDDGNVVVYTSANKPLWGANSHISSLAAGLTLTPGQLLYSADDKVRLVMQGDGNLVLYTGSTALWNTHTSGHPGAYATLQTDGNLVVRNTTTALWNSHTNGTPTTRLQLQTDHNLVLYTATGTATWQSGTAGSGSQDTSVVGGSITRAQVMTRINYWVNVVKPPYNDSTDPSTFVDDLEGRGYRPDCSGSVSMAWHMEQSFDTHELNPTDSGFINLTHQIARSALQPGDALVRDADGTNHMVLFVGWADAGHTQPIVDAEPDFGQTETQQTWSAGYAATYVPIAYNRITS